MGWCGAEEIARTLGVSEATLSRVLNGRMNPGVKFIAATLAALPDVEFEQVFEVVPTDPSRPVPS